jgi:hypothetical protein
VTLEPLGAYAVALVLQALAEAGWSPVVTTPLAGGMIAVDGSGDEAPVGVLVIVEKNGVELRAIAATTAEALAELGPQMERFEGRRLVA